MRRQCERILAPGETAQTESTDKQQELVEIQSKDWSTEHMIFLIIPY